MAATLFDLNVSVSNPASVKGISEDSKALIFTRPVKETRKPKQAGNIIRSEAPEEGPEPLSLEDISEGYGELIDRLDRILETLESRLGNLVHNIDPEIEPAVAEALGRIFSNENKKITYKMYLAALRLDKDISVQLGESESGFVK